MSKKLSNDMLYIGPPDDSPSRGESIPHMTKAPTSQQWKDNLPIIVTTAVVALCLIIFLTWFFWPGRSGGGNDSSATSDVTTTKQAGVPSSEIDQLRRETENRDTIRDLKDQVRQLTDERDRALDDKDAAIQDAKRAINNQRPPVTVTVRPQPQPQTPPKNNDGGKNGGKDNLGEWVP